MEINLNHFKLDKYNIEKCALEQASLYQFYAGLVADKQYELDKANLRLDQRIANIKNGIKNSNPKATIDMMENQCLANEDVIREKSAIIDLKHDLATLKTAVMAMEQRRDMIQVESRLQNNALYQQADNVGDHSSAEWAENVLRKQLNK